MTAHAQGMVLVSEEFVSAITALKARIVNLLSVIIKRHDLQVFECHSTTMRVLGV